MLSNYPKCTTISSSSLYSYKDGDENIDKLKKKKKIRMKTGEVIWVGG